MRDEHPHDFHKAIQFEKSIRARDNTLYLHPTARTLDEADIDKPGGVDNADCSLGFCTI